MTDFIQEFDPRQEMNCSAFEVFHYKEPYMRPLPLHHHDFYEVYFFLSGVIDYRIEGHTYNLRRGDILLINPYELHQPISPSNSLPYERMVLWINSSYLNSLFTDLDLTQCFTQRDKDHSALLHLTPAQIADIFGRFQHLVKESRSHAFGNKEYAKTLFMQLLLDLNRFFLKNAIPEGDSMDTTLTSSVMTYIGKYYAENLSLQKLAQHFYVNEYYLSHTFSETVGSSIYHYLLMKRLAMARQFLAEGMSAKEACRSCGYNDYANFYRAFRAEYGMTPSEYAKSMEHNH